jgi:FixJ family two-component response regulator
MHRAQNIIFIIDDDPSVRRSLSLLLGSAGYMAVVYPGIDTFFEMEEYKGTGCILMDVFLEDQSGLDLQEEVKRRFGNLPIIYMSGFGNIPMSVQALKKGALDFLQKPVDDRKLLGAVEEALLKSAALVNEKDEHHQVKSLIDKLTPREYEIFRFIITGMLNKQIAARLNISEHTVKLHRGKITEKLGARSVAEMVRLAQKINLI